MKPPEGERKIILVVKDRELFTVLLRSFSCDYFEVLFAEGPTDALSLGSLRNLRLVTVPYDSKMGIDLAGEFKEMSEDVTVLGTTAKTLESLSTTEESVDQVVASSDLKEVASAARRLLGERRKRPRVMVDFPVKLGERGIGIVNDLSSISLLVETMLPLDEGERVQVEIGEGDSPFQFEARVGRMQRSALGKSSMVLTVSAQIPEARDYLEQLVWKLMEVQYYLNGSSSRPGVLRGPMSWEMARRVERNLRESQELRIISAPQVTGEPPADQVESRYRLGQHLGRWGVGEIYSASHLLLKRPVVLKILREDLKDSETARQRLENEAIVPTNVSCPCIVDIVDFDSDGHGGLFYAMEALTGETLASSMERGIEYSALDIARLGVHLAATLAIAHMRGYGHYDLCPQNVFLQKWSVGPAWPVLINMGGCPAGGALADMHPMGKDFWPPEVHEEPPGPRHDLHGLGALLEHLCCQAPAGDAQGFELLREGISLATATEPGDRYPDMNVMAHSLVKCCDALESSAAAEDIQQIESPHDLKKIFEQSASVARTTSNRFVAEAMAVFAVADPRPEEPSYAEIEIGEPPEQSSPSPVAEEDGIEVAETPEQSSPSPVAEDDGIEVEVSSTEVDEEPDLEVEVNVTAARSSPEDSRGGDDGGTEDSPPEPVVETAAEGKPAKAPPAGRSLPPWALFVVAGVLAIGGGIWMQVSNKTSTGAPTAPEAPAPRGRKAGPKVDRAVKKHAIAVRPSRPERKKSSKPPADAAVTTTPPSSPDARPITAAAAKPARSDAARGGKRQRKAAIKEARALIKQGKHTEALRRLEAALQIRDSARLRSLLAQTCEKTGQYRQAIEHLKKVTEQKPDVAWYQDKMGRLYLLQGKAGLACEAFKRALKILPSYPVSKANLRKHCKR